jgi:hypothetical protein
MLTGGTPATLQRNGQIGSAHIVANAGAMLGDWHIA